MATPEELNKVFILLRAATGTDFTYYKDTTIRRRIARRMVLHKIDKMAHYIRYLEGHPQELKSLFQDILINVTSFFREPATFEVLRKKLFALMLKNRQSEDVIRIWTAGCSTGEETYSVAISLIEFLGAKAATAPIQIFGTDLSDWAMEKARAGFYPHSIGEDVSAERLRRFFVKSDSGFQVSKQIRDLCVFARHDLTRDPPFSRLDLILCRNVLIYLGPILQKKVMKVFHYALKPAGWLMLGSSETIGGAADLFTLRDKKHKLYARKSTSVGANFAFAPGEYGPPEPRLPRRRTPSAVLEAPGFDLIKQADHLVMSRFAPPGVVVDENMNILQFRGETENYLKPAAGEASLNILKMAREGLLVELRAALLKAIKSRDPVSRTGVQVVGHNGTNEIDLEIVPLKAKSDREQFFLVLFQPKSGGALSTPVHRERGKARGQSARQHNKKDNEIHRLKQELRATNDYLQSIIEEQEATNEEVRSTNEEIQSSNEELQSTNEELETAKEELQSTNEELTTVNEELHNRNVELSQSNDDLTNVLNNVSLPIIIMGPDLRIRRFTPQAQSVMNVIDSDIGRPLGDIKLHIDIPDLEQALRRVIDSLSVEERDVQDRKGRWYLLRIRPYRTLENKIDGAVLALIDIDAIRHGIQQLKEARAYLKALGQFVREPLLVLDKDMKVQIANEAFAHLFLTPVEEVEGKLIYELGDGEWKQEKLRTLLEHLLVKSNQFEDFEIEADLPRIGRRRLYLTARRICDDRNETQLILLLVKEKRS